MKFAGLLLSLIPSLVSAFPTGAGGCDGGGVSAPKGLHLREGFVQGTLADGVVTVTFDGTELAAGSTYQSTPTADVTLTVTSNSTYRGILVRVEGNPDFPPIITSADTLLRDADDVCTDPGVVGITHNSRDDKSSSTVVITTLVAAELTIDINVVEVNNGVDGSIFYHDSFTIQAAHPPCDICAGKGPMGSPEAILTIPENLNPFGEGEGTIACEDAEAAALAGNIDPSLCVAASFATGPCNCGVTPGPGDDTDEPTSSPAMEPSAAFFPGRMDSVFVAATAMVVAGVWM